MRTIEFEELELQADTLHGCWEWKPGTLKEQYVICNMLLAMEPSIQPVCFKT